MSSGEGGFARGLLRVRLVRPGALLAGALLAAGFFLVCHAAGLREYACLLAGTYPSGAGDPVLAELFCAIYLAAYAGFVLVAPVLLLAAGVFAVLERVLRGRLGRAEVVDGPARARYDGGVGREDGS